MPVLRSQSRWAIDKFPRNIKSFRQMRRERFHAENFRGVMPADQKVHAEFFSSYSGPVRSFASNKRVNVFLCDAVDFRTGGASYNADRASLFRTEIKNLYQAVQHFPQFTNEFGARHYYAHFQPDPLVFLLQKWLRRFESQRGDELCIVANFRVNVQRQVRTVERNVIFKRELQLATQRFRYRLQSGPEQAVVHDQKIDVFLRSFGKNTGRNIYRRAEPRDSP